MGCGLSAIRVKYRLYNILELPQRIVRIPFSFHMCVVSFGIVGRLFVSRYHPHYLAFKMNPYPAVFYLTWAGGKMPFEILHTSFCPAIVFPI